MSAPRVAASKINLHKWQMRKMLHKHCASMESPLTGARPDINTAYGRQGKVVRITWFIWLPPSETRHVFKVVHFIKLVHVFKLIHLFDIRTVSWNMRPAV